jgi:hypothetical protein
MKSVGGAARFESETSELHWCSGSINGPGSFHESDPTAGVSVARGTIFNGLYSSVENNP